MKKSIFAATLLSLFLMCCSAFCQTASITVVSASAAGDLGTPGNTSLSGVFTESFLARSLRWSGSITSDPNPFFFEEDVFASIEGPNGLGYTGPVAGEQGIFLGTTPFSGWTSGFSPASVNGAWNFEAYTPNTASSSTNWSIVDTEFTFTSELFPTSTNVSVGTSFDTPLTEGEILWFALNHNGGPLSISTAGSTIFELDGNIQVDDTLIALFDAAGQLVDFNDDVGGGDLTSLLTFSNLATGEYRLAATGSTFGTRVGNAFLTTSHDGEGTVRLNIAVPEPTSLSLLLGVAMVVLRRRQQAS